MRLFLSSQDLGKYAHIAVQMAGKNRRAAYIKNSQDDKPPQERNFSTPEKKTMFEKAGFEFEEIDLRNYFGKSEELKAKLSDFGSIWCAGGNTFILRRAMRASGLDDILKDWLAKDKVLYGGWSAGACVTAKSLKGIDGGDRPSPDAVPDNYPIKKTIWDGLGLVDFMIVPHCNMDWFKDSAKEAISYLKRNKVSYRALDDGQVIAINGNKEEFLK